MYKATEKKELVGEKENKKGSELQDQGKYDAAIKEYEAAYSLNPLPEFLFNKGNALTIKAKYLQKSNHDLACDSIGKAIEAYSAAVDNGSSCGSPQLREFIFYMKAAEGFQSEMNGCKLLGDDNYIQAQKEFLRAYESYITAAGVACDLKNIRDYQCKAKAMQAAAWDVEGINYMKVKDYAAAEVKFKDAATISEDERVKIKYKSKASNAKASMICARGDDWYNVGMLAMAKKAFEEAAQETMDPVEKSNYKKRAAYIIEEMKAKAQVKFDNHNFKSMDLANRARSIKEAIAIAEATIKFIEDDDELAHYKKLLTDCRTDTDDWISAHTLYDSHEFGKYDDNPIKKLELINEKIHGANNTILNSEARKRYQVLLINCKKDLDAIVDKGRASAQILFNEKQKYFAKIMDPNKKQTCIIEEIQNANQLSNSIEKEFYVKLLKEEYQANDLAITALNNTDLPTGLNLVNLGEKHLTGDGVETNYAIALEYFKKAAEADKNNTKAKFYMGEIYRVGENGVTKDYTKALYWHSESAEQGFASSQDVLGDMYKNGHGVTKNYATAKYWYEKAASQGNENSKKSLQELNKLLSIVNESIELGEKHLTGDGVERNYAIALKHFKKAAEVDKNNTKAKFYIGEIYRVGGNGVDINDNEALDWHSESAKQGFASSQDVLGDMYKTRQDYATAKYWYEKAAAQGNENSKKSLKELNKLLSKASESIELGEKHLTGDGVERNYAIALEQFKKAAEADKNNTKAKFYIGEIYRVGGNGVDINDNEALHWHSESAKQGFASSQDVLGDMYKIRKDYDKAKYWYKKAADQGNENSKKSLQELISSSSSSSSVFLPAFSSSSTREQQRIANVAVDHGIPLDLSEGEPVRLASSIPSRLIP